MLASLARRSTCRPLVPLKAVPTNRVYSRRSFSHTAFVREARSADVPRISYEELKPITQSPTGRTLIIDVREPDEVALGNIPSSVNLPLSKLQEALELEPPLFSRTYSFKKPEKQQDIVFYCQAGIRAATALKEFRQKGYKHVRNYEGSYKEWTEREKGNMDD